MIKRHVPLENLILNLNSDSLTHVLNTHTDFSYTRSFETEIHLRLNFTFETEIHPRHLTYMKLRNNLEFEHT